MVEGSGEVGATFPANTGFSPAPGLRRIILHRA